MCQLSCPALQPRPVTLLRFPRLHRDNGSGPENKTAFPSLSLCCLLWKKWPCLTSGSRVYNATEGGALSPRPQGEYPPCLFFFCSSSSPGTPGMPRKVLWEFPYHTSSSWSGGIICRERGRGGQGGGPASRRQGSLTPALRKPKPGLSHRATSDKLRSH